jgi:hypothetical protein
MMKRRDFITPLGGAAALLPMALSGATLMSGGRSCPELSIREAKAGAAVESIRAPTLSTAQPVSAQLYAVGWRKVGV